MTLSNDNMTVAPFKVGAWTVHPDTGRITKGNVTETLEPKVMGLLLCLVRANGAVLSRDDLEQSLWGGAIVGEDTVARTVSRLRKAFGDNAKSPSYIETLPRRGYRLIAEVEINNQKAETDKKHKPVIGIILSLAIIILVFGIYNQNTAKLETPTEVAQLTARADNLYMQFTHDQNEAAIALYERVLAHDTDYAPAQSGLANALVQRVVRWPTASQIGNLTNSGSIQEALNKNMHETPDAQKVLSRATALAERAVRLNPKDADALKALGLVYSSQNRLDEAEDIYKRALVIDLNAWEVMVNLSEIYTIKNEPIESVKILKNAFNTMGKVYISEPQRVGPWQAALGVLIGQKLERLDKVQEAEIWYRKTLEISPYEPEATIRLAHILRQAGDNAQANQLCTTLKQKTGGAKRCD